MILNGFELIIMSLSDLTTVEVAIIVTVNYTKFL